MFRNYIKTAYRNLLKNKTYAIINIVGLTVGIACCMGILVYVQYELSYDQFHDKKDRIFRVMRGNPEGKVERPSTPTPLLPLLKESFPQIEKTASLGQDPVTLYKGDKRFYYDQFYWTDSAFFEVFDFQLLQGSPKTALSQVNNIVLTRYVAEKMFGQNWEKQSLVGQFVDMKIYDGNQQLPMKISGVMENLPQNSHLQFDVLGSLVTTKNVMIYNIGDFEKKPKSCTLIKRAILPRDY